jgi:hypothetical protein
MHDRVCPPRRMRFSFESRCRLVSLVGNGMSPQAAAAACGASRATGYRLWQRFQEGGWSALAVRSPVPRRQPRRPSPEHELRILAAREYARWSARRCVSAQHASLDRVEGAAKARALAVASSLPWPVRRYERARPGELLHVDIKKLGRFWTRGKRILGPEVGNRSRRAGRQYLHVAIDDHSRLTYAELLASESPSCCAAFLRRAVGWYREQGVMVERLLSDNGNGYRSRLWRATCAELELARRSTRPRRPQTSLSHEEVLTLDRSPEDRPGRPSRAVTGCGRGCLPRTRVRV